MPTEDLEDEIGRAGPFTVLVRVADRDDPAKRSGYALLVSGNLTLVLAEAQVADLAELLERAVKVDPPWQEHTEHFTADCRQDSLAVMTEKPVMACSVAVEREDAGELAELLRRAEAMLQHLLDLDFFGRDLS